MKMAVKLTQDIVNRTKAELIRGQSLSGACRIVGITRNSCNQWRSAGEAILDGRPHRDIPNQPKRYSYENDESYNIAMSKYQERCNLLIRFFIETEKGRGEVSGHLLDVLFRLIERGDIKGE